MIEFCANIVIILQSRFIFNSFLGIADVERLDGFCSDCEWAVTHATRSSESSQGCRED